MRHRRLWWNELCYSASKKMSWREGIFLSAHLGSMPVVSSLWMVPCQQVFSKASFSKLIQDFKIPILLNLSENKRKEVYLNLGSYGAWKGVINSYAYLYVSLTKIQAKDHLIALHLRFFFSWRHFIFWEKTHNMHIFLA